jgi:hypothetical protein
VTNFGVPADAAGIQSGATTIVDQGSSGAWTLGGFKVFIADPARTDVRAFVSINVAGAMQGGMEGTTLHNPGMVHVESLVRIAQDHPQLVRGMNKLVGLGMSLTDAVRALTATPARVLADPSIGHLGAGARANITVLRPVEGEWTFADSRRERLTVRERLLPDLVVMDPPRAGLEPGALKRLVRMAPKRITYVSCEPPTLARDLVALREGASVSAGDHLAADALIRLAFSDAEDLVDGTVTSADALREGRLKVRGDLVAVVSLVEWLKRAHPRAEG